MSVFVTLRQLFYSPEWGQLLICFPNAKAGIGQGGSLGLKSLFLPQ